MNSTGLKAGLCVLTLVIFANHLFAGNWNNFSNYTEATSVAIRGNEVWMSAKGGLLMYDKNTGERKFFQKSPDELPSLSVERVAVNPHTNDIWIGTYDNGLAILHENTWTHVAFPDSGTILYEMKITADGAIWSATSQGLYRYENGQFTKFLSQSQHDTPWDIDLFPNGRILCGHFTPFIFDPSNNTTQNITTTTFAYGTSHVYVKSDSEYYFATDHGELARFIDTAEVDTMHLPVMMWDMASNSSGELLMLSGDYILRKYVNDAWEKVELGGEKLLSCFTLANGELWAGGAVSTNKLVHLDAQNQVRQVDVKRTELNHNWIAEVSGSDDGNVLILSEAGIQKFDLTARSFSDIALPSALQNSNINEVIELNGKIYVGSATSYLYEYSQQNGWQQLGYGTLPHQDILHLDKDAQGNLWMCGYGFAAKYDGAYFTVFDSMDESHLKQYTRDIYCDNTRNLVWFSTYDGIFKIDNGTVSFYNDLTPGIQQYYDAVETINEDAEHNIWFGTVYGGVLKYDGSSFSTMLLPVTAGNQFISDIAFVDDVMYISDNLNGVWVYENDVWSNFNTENSMLADNYVTALHTDNDGNLWIAHLSYGIDVYNKNGVSVKVPSVKNDLNAVAFPNPSEGKFILQWSDKESADVKVYSADGKLAQQQLNFISGSVLDLTTQTPGIYIAEVKTKSVTGKVKLMVW